MRSMEFRIPYGAAARQRKKAEIARHFKVDGPFLFLHVHLVDNRSEFTAPLDVKIWKEDDAAQGQVKSESPRRSFAPIPEWLNVGS